MNHSHNQIRPTFFIIMWKWLHWVAKTKNNKKKQKTRTKKKKELKCKRKKEFR